MLITHRCEERVQEMQRSDGIIPDLRNVCSCPLGRGVGKLQEGLYGATKWSQMLEESQNKHMVIVLAPLHILSGLHFFAHAISLGYEVCLIHHIHLISLANGLPLLQASQKPFAGKVLSKSSSNPEAWIFMLLE